MNFFDPTRIPKAIASTASDYAKTIRQAAEDYRNKPAQNNSYGLNPQLYGTGNPPRPDLIQPQYPANSNNNASGNRQESNQSPPKPNYFSTDALDNPISRKLDSMFSGEKQDQQQTSNSSNNQEKKNMVNPYIVTPLGAQVNYNQGVTNSPLNTQPVGQLLSNGQYVIDPNQQLATQYQYANQTANDEWARQQAGLAYGTGILNQTRNADTQRLMAVNAQQQAATNVANQLANLASIRTNGANTIASVLNSALNTR